MWIQTLRVVIATSKSSQKELEESWKHIWSPQESMKLTCSMNYTRIENICCNFSFKKFVFKHWKWPSIHAVRSLRSRFILAEKLSNDITYNLHEQPVLFIIAVYHYLFQDGRDWETQINVMKVRRSGSLRTITWSQLSGLQGDIKNPNFPTVHLKYNLLLGVWPLGSLTH